MLKTEGYYLQGHYLGLIANRTSYAFDFRGPSYVCDTACSSTLSVLVNAISDLKNGIIDSAVVAGTHLNLLPYATMEFSKLNMLSSEGYCRSFSSKRDGYCRSEAVVSFFIQLKNNCRRSYATIAGARMNVDGYKKEGISFPSYKAHLQLMEDVYRDFDIDPNNVTYFEAHGTGKKIIKLDFN